MARRPKRMAWWGNDPGHADGGSGFTRTAIAWEVLVRLGHFAESLDETLRQVTKYFARASTGVPASD